MTGRGGRVGVEQGERGKPLHSLGRVCQSAWAKNGVLVRVAGHQPRLLLLVSISSLEQSSQGQALSWALPAPASPPGPSDPFVFLTHSPPPPMLSPLIRYSLSSPPPFFPTAAQTGSLHGQVLATAGLGVESRLYSQDRLPVHHLFPGPLSCLHTSLHNT